MEKLKLAVEGIYRLAAHELTIKDKPPSDSGIKVKIIHALRQPLEKMLPKLREMEVEMILRKLKEDKK